MIDARDTDYIDADVLDLILEFRDEIAPARGIHVSLAGFKDRYQQLKDRVQFIDHTTRELQASLTPDAVLRLLREGNHRFRDHQPIMRDLTRQLEATATVRHPVAAVLSGASSRTPVEMIFDVGLGDIFCARVSGSIVSVGVMGTLEYACAVAGAKLIIVLGHANSDIMRMAITSFLAGQSPAETTGCVHLDPIVTEVQKSIDPDLIAGWAFKSPQAQQDCLDELYHVHLLRTIDRILNRSTVLRGLVETGRLKVIGGMYDVRSGNVDFFERRSSLSMQDAECMLST
jgi:carbonic anhydrase/SulP family sulfate permease